MRSPITVRIIKNSEGDLLRQIVSREMADDLKELDWDHIEPYWLGAIQDGNILAVCQVLVGMPIGTIEFLCFSEDYIDMQKARILKVLMKRAIAGLVMSGSTAAASTVPFSMKAWKKIIKRQWGGYVYSTGNLLMKRLV